MSKEALSSRAGRGIRRFITVLLIEPIREGRIKDTGWPAGLGTIVACATVAFFGAVGIVLAAPTLRELLPLSVTGAAVTISLPRALLPIFFLLIVFSVTLLQTAALHARLLVAVPITVVTSTVLLFLGGLDRENAEGLPVSAGKAVSVVAVLAVVALLVLRRRRVFVWWEFGVLLVILGGTAVLAIGRTAADSAAFGVDFGPSTASLVMSSLGSLAVPAAVAAGVAVAELAVTLALAIVAAVRSRYALDGDAHHRAAPERATPRPVLRSVLFWFFAIVGILAVAQIVLRSLDGSAAPSPIQLLSSAALIGATALAVAGIGRVRLPRGAHGRAAAGVCSDELRTRLGGLLFPVAAALTAILGPLAVLLLLAQVLYSWGSDQVAISIVLAFVDLVGQPVVYAVLRTVAAAVFLVVAVRGARRGWRGSPELLAAFGVIVLVTSIPDLFGLSPVAWSSDALAILLTAGTLTIAVLLATRGLLTESRLASLAVTLLLAEAVAWREILANPLSALLGASAIAVILLGFVWGFLTGAEPTRAGSARYPVAVRVLLFLANAVFGVTILAFAAIARDLDAAIDLDKFSDVGDVVLGTGFLLVVAVVLWAGALRRTDAVAPETTDQAEPTTLAAAHTSTTSGDTA